MTQSLKCCIIAKCLLNWIDTLNVSESNPTHLLNNPAAQADISLIDHH